MATVTTRYRCPVTPDECPSSPRRGFCPNHDWEPLVPERVYLTAESEEPAAETVRQAVVEAAPAPAPPAPGRQARAEPSRAPTPAPAPSRPAAAAPQVALVLLGVVVPVQPADRGRTTLGRDAPDCAHVPGLEALDQVSRVHAELRWEAGRLYVTDSDSVNGTFVDGVRVTRPVQLWPGAHRLQLAQEPEAVDVNVIELDEYGAPR
ncbi:FHA domain-containing protein [Streptomyces sp. NBC_01198]|uniref:FHA domain-containing protein n=1 Tax=Streptomyces sp. NBC_01198 TaxID=2903769 RepID=UPI002E156DD9|nr:FHA domain-containing protein [Streptomyces sp. NBC_01198]